MWAELLFAAALTAAECPPTADGSVLPSSNPDWMIKPSPEDIWWAYPPKARADDVAGRATITCNINVDGVPEDCTVVSEQPADYGFGEAAVSLASRMRFRPMIRCGRAERSHVRIPIAFSLPEDAPASDALAADDPRLPVARRLAEAMKVPALVDRDLEEGTIDFISDGKDLSANERKAIYQAYTETRHDVRERMVEAMAHTMGRLMSMEEMEQAIAFYSTPAGSKLTWGGELLPAIWRDIGAMKPSPFAPAQRRFCELSPKSCVAEKP